MALRVICPNNCRLQVPDSRAGGIVRCPKCRKPIKIGDISEAKPGKTDDDLLTVKATVPSDEELAKLKREVKQPKKRKKKLPKPEPVATTAASATSVLTERTENVDNEDRSQLEQATSNSNGKSNPDLNDLPKTTEYRFEQDNTQSESDLISSKSKDGRWLVEKDEGKQTSKKRSTKSRSSKSSKTSDLADSATKTKKSNGRKPGKTDKGTEKSDAETRKPPKLKKRDSKKEKTSPESKSDLKPKSNAKTTSESKQDETDSSEASPQEEIKRVGVTHNKDAKSRSTFLAFSLFLVGIFSIIPAVGEFIQYANSEGTTEIHRWAAWLVFIGVMNIFYAVYVGQLADWTSVWLVSIVMIGLSVVTATLLAGLALSNPQTSLIATQLEIAPSLKLRAEIWLLTMLSITSLIAYLSGREAFRWKKIEKNLQAISTQTQ